ncbi:hypothetical protein N7452_000620 [Penicillium brevicompactum]|uniref:Zn(2)-C6 fungal-type domain-containing protein n=1 Tax=Penicillium brevicompactum TaxID=5074 RepID=A0A9W9R0W5_PENBR|nr:hypothetical protein N7452_000620 [Penicillium brevicompactum]
MPSPNPQHKLGLACEECRRRKLRCDRRQPSCGLCETSGVECQITARPPRGPKRGYLKLLQNRIEPFNYDPEPDFAALDDHIDLMKWQFPITIEERQLGGDFDSTKTSIPSAASSVDGLGGVTPSLVEGLAGHCGLTSHPMTIGVNISKLMEADLQLYFDRVQRLVPILHKSRYVALRHYGNNTDEQNCLRYAMWTLAASFSAHRQNVGESLYQYTQQLLHSLDSSIQNFSSNNLEQIQAWILLAVHEFMCVDFRRGWVSAGRAFRLIQLNWRHGIDGSSLAHKQRDWVESEEIRRTFWMAYCLDRFVSIRIGSPLTLSENVAIRLPCPEINFQNGQPIIMEFLPEALAASAAPAASAFTECIIAATISGRVLSHRHHCEVGDIYQNSLEDLWTRHEWINTMHNQWMQNFFSAYAVEMQQSDPMALSIALIFLITRLHLHETALLIRLAVSCCVTEDGRAVEIIDQNRFTL